MTSAAGSRLASTPVSPSEAAGRPPRACSMTRAVSWSGAVARTAPSRTTRPAQPAGPRPEPRDTATLMAGANRAAPPARYSHSSLALAISAAGGGSVSTDNERTPRPARRGQGALPGPRRPARRETGPGPPRLMSMSPPGVRIGVKRPRPAWLTGTGKGSRFMRSITVTMWVTLDGVVQGLGRADEDTRGGFTHGGWGERYQDEVMGREMAKGMSGPGDMLFGRRTWQDFITAWARRTDGNPFTERMNATTKYVVSKTLENADAWENSVLLRGDAAAAVAELKDQPGNDLGIIGSASL